MKYFKARFYVHRGKIYQETNSFIFQANDIDEAIKILRKAYEYVPFVFETGKDFLGHKMEVEEIAL